MTNLDYLYDKVAKGKPTRDELLEIIDKVGNTNSFGNTSFTTDDLFLKISKSPNCTDDMIKHMYDIQVENYRGEPDYIAKMLDNGSKKLFDKLWGDKNTYGKWIKLWKSKHADSKQLEEFWNDVIKDSKGTDKEWLKNLKHSFFRHPNAPTKILNRQLKNVDSLLNIALNPSLSGKALEAVASFAKVQRYDGVFENLLSNKGLDWKVISKSVDIPEQLKIAFGEGGFLNASFRRKAAILEFFRRKDTPDKALEVMYKITGEEEFLPQAAKDIFIF